MNFLKKTNGDHQYFSTICVSLSQVPRDYDLPDDEAKKRQKEEQSRIDSAEPLTEEEQQEKENLLNQVTVAIL